MHNESNLVHPTPRITQPPTQNSVLSIVQDLSEACVFYLAVEDADASGGTW